MDNYYLGLNMGTTAIGWAVTDPSYHLLRKKGMDTWGVRRFDEAEGSAKTRGFRSTRRAKQRSRDRILYVRGIFEDAISKTDPDFFKRLDESFFRADDKEITQPNSVFADPDFTDKEYHEQYPTIFHLRSELIHYGMEHDVRLVYLAIANIFKHRGHFLNSNLTDEDVADFNEIYSSIAANCKNLTSAPDIDAVKETLASDKISNSRRYHLMAEILGVTGKMPEADALKLICGMSGTVSKLFPEHMFDDDDKKYSFSFRDANYDEAEMKLYSMLDDEEIEFVQNLKQAHDWGLLENIMKGEKYLSDARLLSYKKHGYDLALLKSVYKTYDEKGYDRMFRVMSDYNYSAYVGFVDSSLAKQRRGAKKDRDELYKRIVADISKMKEEHPEETEADEGIAYILEEITNGSFLPKQLTTENRVIPYQTHLKELKRILQNAEEYLPFLKEKDESGLTASERITELFSFRIPYYIGPLFNDGDPSHNAWVVRKEPGKVFPWNLEEKIDVKASSEAFISRMVGECSYITGEKVLPKCSLLYERYAVLNELNKIRINGEPIGPELKKAIFKELYVKNKKVTLKKIKEYIIKNNIMEKGEIYEISGVDGDIKQALTSYRFFCKVFDTGTLTHEQEEMVEQIIFWSTVYGESRAFLMEKIEENYGSVLSAEQIRQICDTRFNGWGELSKALLMLVGEDRHGEDSCAMTIIDRMWDENICLMECLSNDYTYRDILQAKEASNQKSFFEIKNDDLEDLYISAPVRRMLWQSILVIREITEVMGGAPAKIFIEVDKSANIVNRKRRGLVRKNWLLRQYKGVKDKTRDWVKEINAIPAPRFLSKKLYLYYMQQGRCMYTGTPIPLSDLFDNSLYNIDHIYPKQFVMDDNIDKNLVLVKREANKLKDNRYPVTSEIREQQAGFWKMLRKTGKDGLITREKYERLIRSTPFTDKEMADFVTQQMADTRQGTKIITNLFRKSFPGVEVVHAKAGLISEFRRKFEIYRCEQVNNLHFASDAYLGIVVANAYRVKFTLDPINYIKDYRRDPEKHKYHMGKLFEYMIERDGETAWIPGNDGSIETVRSVVEKASAVVTMRNYTKHGQLWDQNALSAKKAGKGNGYIPLRSSDKRLHDVSKYGGYSKYTGAYFFLVEHTFKKNRIRTLENMPLYLMDKHATDDELVAYCVQQLGCVEPRICVNKIKLYSLVKADGFYFYITGRTNNRLSFKPAVELKVPGEWNRYIKRLFSGAEETESGAAGALITKEDNLALYRILAKKNSGGIFGKRPNAIGGKLVELETVFSRLDIEKQAVILKEIIMFDSGKVAMADLSLLGAGKTGAASLKKTVSDYNEFLLISTSPTGFYKHVTDLKRV